jgi:Na+-transporting methylmalonyl-CoA/oxaloacetate decarboxylase gamma subunit
MYTLIVPVVTPFVLLATVMGLSWFEDRVLPPAVMAEAKAGAVAATAAAAVADGPLAAVIEAVIPGTRQPEGAVDRAATTAVR